MKNELLIRKAAFYLKELFNWNGQIEDLCMATQSENPAIDGEEMLATLLRFADTFK